MTVAEPDERWRGMLAALLSDDVRAVLGETAAPASGARRDRAVARLQKVGLVVDDDGDVSFVGDTVRALISSPPRATGPERFLDRDGRIDRYPATADDREELLLFIAQRAFSPDLVLTEADVGEALASYAPAGDVAVLRRYLVDAALLERTRSGSQ